MGDKRWLFDGGLFAFSCDIIVLSKTEKLLSSLCGVVHEGFLFWKGRGKCLEERELKL